MAKSKQTKPGKVYTLKITLEHSDPPIWRSVQVEEAMTLGGLHDTIQATMGWEDCHLHEFEIKGDRYCGKGPMGGFFDDEGGAEEEKVSLGDVILRKGQKFSYCYDFGDNWQHIVKVEATGEREPDKRYPLCLGGERACPPEDSGGLWGYYDMLEVLKDPGHEEYEEYLEWLGDEFDPEAFDLAAVNKTLRRWVK